MVKSSYQLKSTYTVRVITFINYGCGPGRFCMTCTFWKWVCLNAPLRNLAPCGLSYIPSIKSILVHVSWVLWVLIPTTVLHFFHNDVGRHLTNDMQTGGLKLEINICLLCSGNFDKVYDVDTAINMSGKDLFVINEVV